MSSTGTVRIAWQGGEHDFCLAQVGHVLSYEESCNAGIGEVFQRLTAGRYRMQDVREAIRLGLIGGGLAADKALALVKANVDANPAGLAPSVILAIAIVRAVLIGVPDDAVGKKPAPGAKTDQVSTETTVASGAPQSSASAPA